MSKKKFKQGYYAFLTVAWVGMFAPITVWICMNLDKYFVHKSGMTVGMGGILAALFVVLLLKYGIKRFGPVFWMGLLFAISYCLESIITDIVPLSLCAFIGSLIFAVFSLPAKHFKKKLDTYTDEEIRQVVRTQPKTEVTYKGNGRC